MKQLEKSNTTSRFGFSPTNSENSLEASLPRLPLRFSFENVETSTALMRDAVWSIVDTQTGRSAEAAAIQPWMPHLAKTIAPFQFMFLGNENLSNLGGVQFVHAGTDATSENDSLAVVDRRLIALVDAASRNANRLFDAIRTQSTPTEILAVAIKRYAKSRQSAYLQRAAALLECFGAGAWPALKSLAATGGAECFEFVGNIIGCAGVPEVDRLGTILNLAKNPDRNVRMQLLMSIGELPLKSRRKILDILTRDCDDEIREDAASRLSYMSIDEQG